MEQSSINSWKRGRPVAYFSKTLNLAQAKYTATEKECLEMVLGLQHFSIYLLGTGFQTINQPSNNYQWSLALQPYDFDMRYKLGQDHGNAGGLSRQSDAVEHSLLLNTKNIRYLVTFIHTLS